MLPAQRRLFSILSRAFLSISTALQKRITNPLRVKILPFCVEDHFAAVSLIAFGGDLSSRTRKVPAAGSSAKCDSPGRDTEVTVANTLTYLCPHCLWAISTPHISDSSEKIDLYSCHACLSIMARSIRGCPRHARQHTVLWTDGQDKEGTLKGEGGFLETVIPLYPGWMMSWTRFDRRAMLNDQEMGL